MQNIIDFLSFKILITPYLLIACYYVGAIAIPILSWLFVTWGYSKIKNKIDLKKILAGHLIDSKNRALIYLFFVFTFMSMELMWRMMIEFLIAYFQIRDALVVLSN